ncbi:hypothetical protein GCM10010371_41020 [Streptomyces subrutilus]|uniref:Flp family type IVb pilin n=1 Tax=Streptomyces subrutilus TaxID=36818 RepID=A0A5P2UN44_9ACTN|nr:hypothetical protein [Streptomyces subrutilus]QEU79031.1 hypothetical protein CP968_12620 [Streptomyces subrutilus]GGZ77072.1 hypothetical protein GCM10010371_41020 [Streptomyces subrutilus]
MLQKTLARMSAWYVTHRAKDRGQTAFEYLGIILVIVVIIGAMVGTGIGTAIVGRIQTAIASLTAGS